MKYVRFSTFIATKVIPIDLPNSDTQLQQCHLVLLLATSTISQSAVAADGFVDIVGLGATARVIVSFRVEFSKAAELVIRMVGIVAAAGVGIVCGLNYAIAAEVVFGVD